MVLQCQTGQIRTVIDFGYIGRKENKDICKRRTFGACDSSYNHASLRALIEDRCLAKKNCTIDKLRQYVDSSHKNDCANTDTEFFIQFSC